MLVTVNQLISDIIIKAAKCKHTRLLLLSVKHVRGDDNVLMGLML